MFGKKRIIMVDSGMKSGFVFEIFFQRKPYDIGQKAADEGCDQLGDGKCRSGGSQHAGQRFGSGQVGGDVVPEDGKQHAHDDQAHEEPFADAACDQADGKAEAQMRPLFENPGEEHQDEVAGHDGGKHQRDTRHDRGTGDEKCGDGSDDAENRVMYTLKFLKYWLSRQIARRRAVCASFLVLLFILFSSCELSFLQEKYRTMREKMLVF